MFQFQSRIAVVELDENDLDDAERDQLVDPFRASVGLVDLQSEVAALQDLVAQNETTRGLVAKEVHYWGEWVLTKVKAEIGVPAHPRSRLQGQRNTA